MHSRESSASRQNVRRLLRFNLVILQVMFHVKVRQERRVISPFAGHLVQVGHVCMGRVRFFSSEVGNVRVFDGLRIAIIATLRAGRYCDGRRYYRRSAVSSVRGLFRALFIGVEHGDGSLPTCSSEASLVFGFVSSRHSPKVIIPAVYVAFPREVRPVLTRFSGRCPRIDPCEGPSTG